MKVFLLKVCQLIFFYYICIVDSSQPLKKIGLSRQNSKVNFNKMINKVIEESIKIGIPIKCEYVPNRGFVYEVDGFYKSETVSIEEENNVLIATARYNEKTEINTPKDIVELNYKWWEYSKDRYDGWKYPSEKWKDLFDMYGLNCA